VILFIIFSEENQKYLYRKTQISLCLIFYAGDIGNRFGFLPFLLVRGELAIILFWAMKFLGWAGLFAIYIGNVYYSSFLIVENVPLFFSSLVPSLRSFS
jgi:hypothetical protein